MDKVTLQRIDLLDPTLIPSVKLMYEEINKALTGRSFCRFTHTLRTVAEQNELYAQGRTKKGKIVTNAVGGRSYHNYGLAIDICLIIDGKEASWDIKKDFDLDKISDFLEVVSVFEKYGWEWGGRWPKFKDAPHFQYTKGYSIDDLIAISKQKNGGELGYVGIENLEKKKK